MAENMDRTIFVLDWDDTCCPSSWLASLCLLPQSPSSGKSVLSEKNKKKLDKLSIRLIQVLEAITKHSIVFIVTAAERGWIELSCGLYLPNVLPYINGNDDIYTVSARTWYEESIHPSKGTPLDWKKAILQIIAEECFTPPSIDTALFSNAKVALSESAILEGYGDDSEMVSDSSLLLGARLAPETLRPKCIKMDIHENIVSKKSYYLISIGDSCYEREACHAVAKNTSNTISKTIKFLSNPTIKELYLQLQMILQSLDILVHHEHKLDLTIRRRTSI